LTNVPGRASLTALAIRRALGPNSCAAS